MKKIGLYRWPLIILLFFALMGNQVFLPAVVQASSGIEEKDVFVGLGVAVLVYILFQLGRDIRAESPSAQKSPDREEELVSDPETDLELLAHLIHSESRGEPYIGQVAVGAVVLNRVKSSRFPNTIEEVIMAPGQFSVVAEGTFFLPPNETAFKAAREAISGVDPTGGALYFYNPRTARNLSWFLTLRETITIGNHVFAID